MSADLLLAIDQGTSSTRAVAFDATLRVVAESRLRLETSYPRPGWVEQDPVSIERSVIGTVGRVLEAVGGPSRIAAAGLANQGESVVAWDAATLEALAPVVVWQCRRSESVVARLRAEGRAAAVRERSGLPLAAYFSAGKAAWLLEHVPRVREAASTGTLRFGTVDAWLTARLGDRGPITDPSTASRTQLVSLESGDWDDDLMRWFGIGREMLPAILPTVGDAGTLGHGDWGGRMPLAALACDQQAALAGHGAFARGAMKATYGTGVFVLANGGDQARPAEGLEASIAWGLPGHPRAVCLQGGVFAAGALLDWLCDGIGVIPTVSEMESMARRADRANGVRILPALAGLGAPFYDHEARAVMAGLTSASTRDEIAQAALDGIAQRTADVVEAMISATGSPPASLRVDGGLTANGYLMERQADLLGIPVDIATAEGSTALGIAGLAAVGLGRASIDDIVAANPVRRRIEPRLEAGERAAQREDWKVFLGRARSL